MPLNEPKQLPKNPGRADTADWEEGGRLRSYSIVADLQRLLAEKGHTSSLLGRSLVLGASGFVLTPRIVHAGKNDIGQIGSAATMQINHAEYLPNGAFEYLYATEKSITGAFSQGLTDWISVDLPSLLDILEVDPFNAALLKELPNGRARRTILGPTMGACKPQPEPLGGACGFGCACCLFTNSMNTFKHLWEPEETYCLRLLAVNNNGAVTADCRINGEEYEPGKAALREYAATWHTEFQMRKQYVVIHEHRGVVR